MLFSFNFSKNRGWFSDIIENSDYFLENVFDSTSFSFVKQIEEAKTYEKNMFILLVNGISIPTPMAGA